MKKNRRRTIWISGFIVLLLSAVLAFWQFGPYEVMVVRGNAETEGHEDHEGDLHAGEIPKLHNEDKEDPDKPAPKEIIKIDEHQMNKLSVESGTAGPGKLFSTI